jgi:cyanophycinase
MRGQRKVLLVIVSLLSVDLAVLGQASRNHAAEAPFQNSREGIIVLGGGYFEQEDTAALLRRVIDLAGGAGISLVIIPTADSQLEPSTGTGASTSLIDYEKAVSVASARLGVAHVTILHTRDRRVADSEAFVAPLRSANCVWIPGGSPQLLFDVYPKTRVQVELQGVLNRGGVVAGDSAGALLIGQDWLSIDPVQPEILPAAPQIGLGLLRGAFVMAHVNRYKASVVTLGSKTYVSAHQGVSGILIEEHTAVMIQRGQITRLIGSGRAGIVDGSRHGTDSVVWLSGTARYDLHRREFVQ